MTAPAGQGLGAVTESDAAFLALINAHRATSGYSALADMDAVRQAYMASPKDGMGERWLEHERRKSDAALAAAAAARPDTAAMAEAKAEVGAPPDLESAEGGRDRFRRLIGESYTPHVWGQHRALHDTSIRFALDMADRSMPEVADALRAMIWHQVIVDNRALHAWQVQRKAEDRAAAAEADAARLRAVLRQVEWGRYCAGVSLACPCCGDYRSNGHAPDCVLAAALRPAGEKDATPDHGDAAAPLARGATGEDDHGK